MNTWHPISDADFSRLFQEQYAELNASQRAIFNKYRVPFRKAKIQRSSEVGDEFVFVVSQHETGVLYFDDVEFGFNISIVDEEDRILTPGGSQNTLREAVIQWFPLEPVENN